MRPIPAKVSSFVPTAGVQPCLGRRVFMPFPDIRLLREDSHGSSLEQRVAQAEWRDGVNRGVAA
jgi:hypothetical protein